MAQAATREATYADIEALPEWLVGEIIDGVLETHPRPRPRHGVAALQLAYELEGPFGRGRGGPGGWVFMVEPELHFGRQVVVPDIAGWRAERLTRLPETAYLEVPPDWVCEVLSPSTARLDRGPKRRIYGQVGLPHYWLLDPSAGELEAFELVHGRWVLLDTVQRGEAVCVAPFGAVSFPLDDLFPFDAPEAPQPPSPPEA